MKTLKYAPPGRVDGNWAYCGMYAMSVITGKTYEQCGDEVLRLRRLYLPFLWRRWKTLSHLKGLVNLEMEYLCRKAGKPYTVKKLPEPITPINAASQWSPGVYVAYTHNHVVVIDTRDNTMIDNFSRRWQAIPNHRFGTAKVLYAGCLNAELPKTPVATA